ncbi:MAG: class I SAM-dependent methyltransferase [Gammaproteobacteria bacterium]|nr:class I SAM-dependent methyltransferase [Gammaproteobacteria bacterium]
MPDYIDFVNHPKTCEPDDFWGQVKRTINGKTVSEDQIEMIVKACTTGLAIDPNDRLLDLCCGNGALSKRIFSECAGGTGVDSSESLIAIARQYFEIEGRERYFLDDVLAYAQTERQPEQYTKAMCYGSIQYIPTDILTETFATLHRRFVNIKKVFIGNVPDRDRAPIFYADRPYDEELMSNPRAALGIWWQQEALTRMLKDTGWNATISLMPPAYYCAHYRYDVLLTRN